MKAQLDASLCSPAGNPVSLKIDKTTADVTLKGKPRVTLTLSAPPLSVGLPTVKVRASDKLLAALSVLGLHGTSLPAGAGFADLLQSIVGLFGHTGAGLEDALEVTFTPLTLNAVPATDKVLPVEIKADLDLTSLDGAGLGAALGPLGAALKGCIVLNGGDGADTPATPDRPSLPVISSITGKLSASMGGHITIHGMNFGTTPGPVILISQSDGTSHALTVRDPSDWTDTAIVAWAERGLPRGPALILVYKASGGSPPARFTVDA
jgi:hypothetical protein